MCHSFIMFGLQVVCLKCGDILDDDAAFEEHREKHK